MPRERNMKLARRKGSFLEGTVTIHLLKQPRSKSMTHSTLRSIRQTTWTTVGHLKASSGTPSDLPIIVWTRLLRGAALGVGITHCRPKLVTHVPSYVIKVIPCSHLDHHLISIVIVRTLELLGVKLRIHKMRSLCFHSFTSSYRCKCQIQVWLFAKVNM